MSMAFSPPQAQGTVPPPSAPGISGVLPGQVSVNTTRILSLTGFSRDLKTRDIQAIFVDFEDDRGGYRIKWLDDTGCLLVFNDALTGETCRTCPFDLPRLMCLFFTAKRAFLNLLANPHPHLQTSTASDGTLVTPKLVPYTAEDAGPIVASVANRPRSRSVSTSLQNGTNGSPSAANGNNHSRRLSNSTGGNGSYSRNNAVGGVNGSAAFNRTYVRPSMSQGQMQAIMDEAVITEEQSSKVNGSGSPPSPSAATNMPNGGAIDWSAHQQVQSTATRSRGPSVGNGAFASPPISPERGLGATSPSRLRRMMLSSRS